MITIVPAYEVLRSEFDENQQSDAADLRRNAFRAATELKSQVDCEVLIDGQIYNRIEHLLNEDHRTFVGSIYEIDYSTVDVPDFNEFQHVESVEWIATSEAKTRHVIILTQNPDEYSVGGNKIRVLGCEDFIEKISKAHDYRESGTFSDLQDALMASFFFNS